MRSGPIFSAVLLGLLPVSGLADHLHLREAVEGPPNHGVQPVIEAIVAPPPNNAVVDPENTPEPEQPANSAPAEWASAPPRRHRYTTGRVEEELGVMPTNTVSDSEYTGHSEDGKHRDREHGDWRYKNRKYKSKYHTTGRVEEELGVMPTNTVSDSEYTGHSKDGKHRDREHGDWRYKNKTSKSKYHTKSTPKSKYKSGYSTPTSADAPLYSTESPQPKTYKSKSYKSQYYKSHSYKSQSDKKYKTETSTLSKHWDNSTTYITKSSSATQLHSATQLYSATPTQLYSATPTPAETSMVFTGGLVDPTLDNPCFNSSCQNPSSDMNYVVTIPISGSSPGGNADDPETFEGSGTRMEMGMGVWGALVAVSVAIAMGL